MNIGSRIRECTRPFFSLEFFPPKAQSQWPEFFAMVERLTALKPLFASVTYGAGGSTQDYTIEITGRIRQMGLEPMAHLTCVGGSPEKLSQCLQSLAEVGVENVLALRGDAPAGQALDWEAADFRYAADLVRFVRRVQPRMGVAVAGYPAPHPESQSFSMDRIHTLEKVRAGADFVVSQLFFDVREYFDLVDFMRRQNVTVPVVPGILPVQSFDSIRRVLSMCGANIPGKLYLELEAAHLKGGAEAVREVGLRFAVRQIKQLIDGGAPGIHLYTLNRASLCLQLADEVGL
ncbi:MAG: methylenetetrahydrofolate reductase [Desulfovibrionaceae bacterium]